MFRKADFFRTRCTFVQSLLTTLGMETTWAYSVHGAEWMIKLMVMSIALAVKFK